jgi:hypothetical protein
MRLEGTMLSPAFYGRPLLFPLLAFTIVRESVAHGASPVTPMGMVVFGIVLCTTGDIDGEDGRRPGRKAAAHPIKNRGRCGALDQIFHRQQVNAGIVGHHHQTSRRLPGRLDLMAQDVGAGIVEHFVVPHLNVAEGVMQQVPGLTCAGGGRDQGEIRAEAPLRQGPAHGTRILPSAWRQVTITVASRTGGPFGLGMAHQDQSLHGQGI